METCDECGPSTEALVAVALPSGGILTYCNHHANEYRDAIEARGGLLYELKRDPAQ